MTPATKAKLISHVGAWILKALCATLRFRIHDPDGTITRPDLMIGIFWHNRLLVVPWMFTHYMRPRRSAALTSPSKDGEILAAFLARFGIGAIRGSSSRRGAVALLEMRRGLEAGYDIAITPDGPRGPRYHLNPGVISLAQNTGTPVVCVCITYSGYWQLKSWDRFQIPHPFARVDVTFIDGQKIPATNTPEEFEQQRARIEQLLRGGHSDDLPAPVKTTPSPETANEVTAEPPSPP